MHQSAALQKAHGNSRLRRDHNSVMIKVYVRVVARPGWVCSQPAIS
jgi:hypothetical protein